jgi:hypothetical protein
MEHHAIEQIMTFDSGFEGFRDTRVQHSRRQSQASFRSVCSATELCPRSKFDSHQPPRRRFDESADWCKAVLAMLNQAPMLMLKD